MSLRRVIVQHTVASSGHVMARSHSGKLLHFVSLCFRSSAPIDDIFARLLALDMLDCVDTIQFGADCSSERKSRGYTHAFLITFKDMLSRNQFLVHPEHIALTRFIGLHVEDMFVFDFVTPE